MEWHRKCSMDWLVATHSIYVDCKTNAILTIYLHMQIILTHKCAAPWRKVHMKWFMVPRTTPFAELPKGKGPCVMEEEVADLMDGKRNVYWSYMCAGIWLFRIFNRVFAFVTSLFFKQSYSFVLFNLQIILHQCLLFGKHLTVLQPPLMLSRQYSFISVSCSSSIFNHPSC